MFRCTSNLNSRFRTEGSLAASSRVDVQYQYRCAVGVAGRLFLYPPKPPAKVITHMVGDFADGLKGETDDVKV